MGGLTKYFANNVSKAGDAIRTIGDVFKAGLSRIQGYGGTLIDSISTGGTFVGINYNEIPNMRAAIRNYVTEIQKVLDKLNTQASSDNALKGEELTAAVQKYINAVDKCAKAYVSSLLAYSDQMYEVQHGGDTISKGVENYSEQLASDVTNEADALSSDIEEYKEKY